MAEDLPVGPHCSTVVVETPVNPATKGGLDPVGDFALSLHSQSSASNKRSW